MRRDDSDPGSGTGNGLSSKYGASSTFAAGVSAAAAAPQTEQEAQREDLRAFGEAVLGEGGEDGPPAGDLATVYRFAVIHWAP